MRREHGVGQLPLVSSDEVTRVLLRCGFAHLRTRGSHLILVRDHPAATVSVPVRRELPRGTLRSILRAAGLSDEQFAQMVRA